ncbi:MAG: hypothetical protein HFI33_15320 [Lachnospiraceae bacterium]|nr:hypothetical protein [Lachnospiraceae bacterium]
MQPEFVLPDFVQNSTADGIHRRMMNNLPSDMDDMPGGFPYDFTRPAALELDEFINYHLVRTLMIAFPQYAWDDWLDSHGRQVHLERHTPRCASGKVLITGIKGTEIPAGTVFCTPATDSGPAIGFRTDKDSMIAWGGKVEVSVTAVQPGPESNVKADAVVIMAKPMRGITAVTNPEPITGGTERESNDNFYDRIAAEFDSSMTYLGNDSDFIRWAKEAGAGACVVVPCYNGPGTVKLVLVDGNGRPANEKLLQDVYHHIVSPDDRSLRLLPTACADFVCTAATTLGITYVCTGILHDETTDVEQIKKDFSEAVKAVYIIAKEEGILRYNDVRPILSDVPGLEDFDEFLMNGCMDNIAIQSEEYPETGNLEFTGREAG